ncbi:MAG: hypothetical protein OEO20_08175 [Gemmatimonadota bacterium]|nr:hypothetical protein [Gemmatimonadota bacterium]MDH3368722.1 hypothetical protein [Gemmatimonadota bacterium]MDH3478263.1 hypothetical protein [Gemmatimonadota bacterium]MDH3571379.1 hypothetical protein [Gemmatimonadota bacterium]MDH5549812.1 hypothetical protein [Gemmatimonadota bacterium]
MGQAKNKRKKPSGADAPATTAETPESLDRVRDILFGGHMRAVESRIARIEERLHRERAALRTDLDKQTRSLEASVQKELQALAETLKTERAKRADDLKSLTHDVTRGLKNVDKRLGKLDEATSAADADLRGQLLGHTQSVAAEVAALSARLDRVVQELRAEKADLASLVGLFSDMAVRLSEDLQAPPEG